MSWCRSSAAVKHGCQVFSFKHPNPTELKHDFLWRTTRDLLERGRIGIFNRSYYEEVLIAKVHPEIHVVPADDKLNTRLIVCRIVLDTVEALELSYPKASAARRRELLWLRKKLAKDR
jgi:polyphosphate kinase 2 (PPK2 family)